MIFRFGMIPLFLFSGTFFPVTQLPAWIRPLAYATPLWHGVALCRALSLGTADLAGALGHLGLPGGGRRHRPDGRPAHLPAAAPCLSRRCGNCRSGSFRRRCC